MSSINEDAPLLHRNPSPGVPLVLGVVLAAIVILVAAVLALLVVDHHKLRDTTSQVAYIGSFMKNFLSSMSQNYVLLAYQQFLINENSGCVVKQGYVNTSDGQQIYYYAASPPGGNRAVDMAGNPLRPILFIHGFPGSSSMWYCQMKVFCRLTPVVAIDLRGEGQSTKQGPFIGERYVADIESVLSNLGYGSSGEPVVVVGNSIGGWIAMRYAMAYPSSTSKLVLVGTSAKLYNDANWTLGVDPITFNKLLSGYSTNSAATHQQFLSLAFTDKCPALLGPITQAALAIAEQIDGNTSLAIFSEADWDVVEQMANLTSMTSLLPGANDVFGLKSAEFLRDNILPTTYIHEIDSSGHFPHLTNFPEFNQQLLMFVTAADTACSICPSLPIRLPDNL